MPVKVQKELSLLSGNVHLKKLGYSPANAGMNPGLPDQDAERDVLV